MRSACLVGVLLLVATSCGDNTPSIPGLSSLWKAPSEGAYVLELSREAGDEEVLPCSVDFSLGAGTRLACETSQSADLDQVEIIFRTDTRRGVVIAQHGSGSSWYKCRMGTPAAPQLLSCVEDNSNTTAEDIFGRPGWVSLFPSSVQGVGLPNTHGFGPSTSVFRGSAPTLDQDFVQLTQDEGITEILIVTQLPQDTLEQETSKFVAAGVSAADIHYVPMDWQKYPDFKTPCTQIVDALSMLVAADRSSRRILAHCQLGEDRTGLLSGLYRMLSQGWAVERAFTEEMCENGYSAGNPVKRINYHSTVVTIDSDETPLFLKMAYKIEQGELSLTHLDAKACDTDPANDPGFTSTSRYDPAGHECHTSTRFWQYDENPVSYSSD